MEESPPARSRPEAAAAKDTAAQEQTTVRKPRRLRVPTSLLVTVLVAAVSVWVAPALTRQWDDRQKARELRVAITEEMITKGTRVIYATTKPPLRVYQPAANYDALLAQWTSDSAVLEAKLRAYFPVEVSNGWSRFDEMCAQQLFGIAEELPAAQERHADQTPRQLVRIFGARHFTIEDRSLVSHVTNMAFQRGELILEGFPRRLWMVLLAGAVGNHRLDSSSGLYLALQQSATIQLEMLTDQLHSAHLTGFSTTRRDLLRDLRP
jgi:hypothetical protein